MNAPTPRPETSRDALIRVALDQFGRHGFDAVSTRQLSAAANANIAAIAYHFGGKDGLRLACGQHVVEVLRGIFEGIRRKNGSVDIPSLAPDAAAAVLVDSICAFAGFLIVEPQAEVIARFMVREQLDPSPAFDAIYEGVLSPMHETLCGLFSQATGVPAASDSARIAVFALIGQVVYFRLGRPTVLRRMGWTTIGPTEQQAIVAMLRHHTAAAIAAHRKA